MIRRTINVLICDDDEMNLEINRTHVKVFARKLRRKIKIYAFTRINPEMERLIKNHEIDIAILDIELTKGGKEGIEFAEELKKENIYLPIIFISNYEEYKPTACDIMVIGYLEKPVYSEKFEFLFRRSILEAESRKNSEAEKFIDICVDKQPKKLRISDIICAEKVQKKVVIHSKAGNFEIRSTLNGFAELLPDNFLKVSQSVLVNMDEICTLDSVSVYMSTGDTFTIGRTYQKQVKAIYMRKERN